jgi:dimethylargininase
VLTAITREVSASLERCELTYLDRRRIDLALAREQHRAYERALQSLGVHLVRLPALDDCPDAVFVEDGAVVLDELAVVTNIGTPSRAGEVESLAAALARYRAVCRLHPPATLDGGDVLRVDRTLYVGRSRRTNDEGIEQLRRIAEPHGYCVIAVPVAGALHLKTACTCVGGDMLLANPSWVDLARCDALRVLAVPESEPWGASVLNVAGNLLMPSSYPKTHELLASQGFEASVIELSELQKAEGGPTCLSLIFESAAVTP